MDEALTPPEAKRLILAILADGTVRFTRHFHQEAAKDGLCDQDALNVMRGGVVQPAEWESGAWRYRVATAQICVVVEFVEVAPPAQPDRLTVVTIWRKR